MFRSIEYGGLSGDGVRSQMTSEHTQIKRRLLTWLEEVDRSYSRTASVFRVFQFRYGDLDWVARGLKTREYTLEVG